MILVYDYGTTSVKVALYGASPQPVALLRRELRYQHPAPGWVEFDSEEYLRIAAELTLEIPEGQRKQVAALTVTSQAETVTAVGPDGSALCPSIVWLDNRAVEQHQALERAVPAFEFYRHTGLAGSDPILPLNKLAWLARHRPGVYRQAAKFLLLKDYLAFRLTGEMATDPSIASTSGCYDIVRLCWWKELLDAQGLDMDKLPGVCPAGEVVGRLLPDVAGRLGLPAGLPVVNGLLDQAASALGSGNVAPGRVCETTGTALVATTVLRDFAPARDGVRLPVVRYGVGEDYLAMPYHAVSAMALKWFKDHFCQEEERAARRSGQSVYALLDSEVRQNAAFDPDLFFIPHLCGQTFPSSVPAMRGAIIGCRLETGRPQVARAVMESVGFLLSEVVAAIEAVAGRTKRVYSMGGGAGSALWCQMKADILGREVAVLHVPETTALGSAVLAAKAVGMALDTGVHAPPILYAPNADLHPAYRGKERQYQALLAAYAAFLGAGGTTQQQEAPA